MRKIKWGVLGTADIAQGQTIPGMLQADNCRLLAIAGRRLEKAEAFQKRFGFEKAYDSYDALLADPEVEAVYIPLPNDLHHPWVIRALQAGKHVLCEKPLAVNERQVREMFEAARANHVFLMEAFAYLHSPFVSAVKAELDSGVIGEIRYMDTAFIAGRRPDTDIRLRRETYGGALYDLGCYAVSMALWMMGREPQEVKAAAQFSPRGIDLVTSALLIYENDAVLSAECGMIHPRGRHDRFQICGTLGEISSPYEFNQPGNIPYTITTAAGSVTKTVTARNNYALEVEQLGRCISGEENPHVSEAFSLLNARVIDRILGEIGY